MGRAKRAATWTSQVQTNTMDGHKTCSLTFLLLFGIKESTKEWTNKSVGWKPLLAAHHMVRYRSWTWNATFSNSFALSRSFVSPMLASHKDPERSGIPSATTQNTNETLQPKITKDQLHPWSDMVPSATHPNPSLGHSIFTSEVTRESAKERKE